MHFNKDQDEIITSIQIHLISIHPAKCKSPILCSASSHPQGHITSLKSTTYGYKAAADDD